MYLKTRPRPSLMYTHTIAVRASLSTTCYNSISRRSRFAMTISRPTTCRNNSGLTSWRSTLKRAGDASAPDIVFPDAQPAGNFIGADFPTAFSTDPMTMILIIILI